MAANDAAGPHGAHAIHNADEKHGSAESAEPPERRARLVVTLVCSLILIVVFTMIIYRMINEKAKQEMFEVLVLSPPSLVQEFISKVTTIEKTLEMRTRQVNHHWMLG
ncbi:uncharacterized protein LOC142817617 [Rhipicephalus microplus]|uniref:uncharacterized protein LOC142817617 n=1 Tax=Rhipicephalus microplus TaxID=6941 RepID=UPI003F6A9F9C